MKALPKRKGNSYLGACPRSANGLNESPSEKEGKQPILADRKLKKNASMKALPKRKGNADECKGGHVRVNASMKALPKRKGNGYPKLARNHAAETGASREPRGGYTQNYTLQPHLPPHNSLAREETMRATRQVPVTYQVLAHTKTPAGCFLSNPARVFTYERGWRGSGKPD